MLTWETLLRDTSCTSCPISSTDGSGTSLGCTESPHPECPIAGLSVGRANKLYCTLVVVVDFQKICSLMLFSSLFSLLKPLLCQAVHRTATTPLSSSQFCGSATAFSSCTLLNVLIWALSCLHPHPYLLQWKVWKVVTGPWISVENREVLFFYGDSNGMAQLDVS